MKTEELQAIVDRQRPGVAWCERCGEIKRPENGEPSDEKDVTLWHTQTIEDQFGDPQAVQCGPMHALAVVTDAELREIAQRILEVENERRSADRLAGEVCKIIDDNGLDPRSGAGDALLDYASDRISIAVTIGDVRRVFNGLPTTKVGRLFPEISQYHRRVKYLEGALTYISEGRGRFSRDPQQHADNCIEDMKSVAVAAVAGTWTKEE